MTAIDRWIASRLHELPDARRYARRRVPRMMFDYVDGAAGEEHAAARNRDQFAAIQLLPRGLVNVDQRRLQTHCLGTQWQLPFGIAPMGMCNLTWPGADRMLYRAALAHGMPVGISTAASSALEQAPQDAPGHAWFQLYVGQSIELGMELVKRARDAGYTTLMLTVDVPQVAPRTRDLRNGFKAPPRIGPRQFIDFALHPEWSLRTLATGVPELANFVTRDARGEKMQAFNREEGRGRITWEFLQQLRDQWHGTLLVKGIMHPDDALQAQALGVDGIYVSNHGGRQLDSAPAAITQLPLIRQAVGDEMTLLFDSGIRNGESVVKALALGADYVMLGRPFMYGIGAAGEAGLNRVIELLSSQVSTAMAQIGCTSTDAIGPAVLASPPGVPS